MEKIASILQSLWDFFVSASNIISDVASFLISILGFLWYAWKTLIVWVYKLFVRIADSGVFRSTSTAILNLSDYIWFGAYFIYALLFVIIIRIVIAFVFKLLRLNIDYNALDKNTRIANAWDRASEHHKRMSTRV